MTLIIAVRYRGGIIVASDSQASDLQARTRQTTEDKIMPLSPHIVWGLSGPVGLQERIGPQLKKLAGAEWQQQRLADFRPNLVRVVTKAQKQAAEQYVNLPGTLPPKAELLFSGFTRGAPWILEVDESGQDQEHTDEGFCAIGSGKKAAHHVYCTLDHYEVASQDSELAKLVVYRIMEDAIKVELIWVGFPIQMWVVEESGAHMVQSSELDHIGELVFHWLQREKPTLGGPPPTE